MTAIIPNIPIIDIITIPARVTLYVKYNSLERKVEARYTGWVTTKHSFLVALSEQAKASLQEECLVVSHAVFGFMKERSYQFHIPSHEWFWQRSLFCWTVARTSHHCRNWWPNFLELRRSALNLHAHQENQPKRKGLTLYQIAPFHL